jgi:hypothetical protein
MSPGFFYRPVPFCNNNDLPKDDANEKYETGAIKPVIYTAGGNYAGHLLRRSGNRRYKQPQGGS